MNGICWSEMLPQRSTCKCSGFPDSWIWSIVSLYNQATLARSDMVFQSRNECKISKRQINQPKVLNKDHWWVLRNTEQTLSFVGSIRRACRTCWPILQRWNLWRCARRSLHCLYINSTGVKREPLHSWWPERHNILQITILQIYSWVQNFTPSFIRNE